VKSEYRSILEFDLSVGRSLTMTTAVVPQKESSKFRRFYDNIESWKLINDEIDRLSQKPEIIRAMREEDLKSQAIVVSI
jgi:hypothetical protein